MGRTPEEERAAIALVVEVTSPDSADTVYNDRVVKPPQYAKGGVPLYLLADQETAAWSLYGLARSDPGYQVLAAGGYGESIPVPAPVRLLGPDHGVAWPPALIAPAVVARCVRDEAFAANSCALGRPGDRSASHRAS